MAAPPEKTLRDLNGRWQVNHKLRDDLDGGLKLQGFSWLLRKTFLSAPLYLKVNQFVDEDKKEHVKTEQTTLGGTPAGGDDLRLDWEAREKSDPNAGTIKGKCGWKKLAHLAEDADFLSQGWLPEGDDDEHIEVQAEAVDAGWTSHQVFGFQEVQGERRFCICIVLKKQDQVEKARLVYDYVGPLEK